MIDKRYEFLIFSLLVTMFMSLVISGVLVIVNLGLVDNFPIVWFNAWIKAWIVAFPSVLVIIPMVRKMIVKIVK
ncbi:DUF2798 domain-containing protein [Sulfurospirillum arcachonense]|uniref:DUF2798 domain-containing protein n=1 Tax=Sulfurospirillum arcachonense TaxID=57666 RepID=UPI00046959D4|nr:DUF2798 domain-containing protein [Sulfurospirillum arcachonense]